MALSRKLLKNSALDSSKIKVGAASPDGGTHSLKSEDSILSAASSKKINLFKRKKMATGDGSRKQSQSVITDDKYRTSQSGFFPSKAGTQPSQLR